MNNLVVDIGNTVIKIGYFVNNTLIDFYKVAHWEQFLEQKKEINPQYAIICDVANKNTEILYWLNSHHIQSLIFGSNFPLPITNHYQTPNTLGLDRLAGLIGGKYHYPEKNVLVIDAGTCVTYDLITQNNIYNGGAISLGLEIRYKAIQNFTANLPLLSPSLTPSFIGTDTASCIHSGVVNGMVAEIESFIYQFQSLYPEIQIVFTGGDAKFFEKQLKNSIFATKIDFKKEHLVLDGLNFAICYQKK